MQFPQIFYKSDVFYKINPVSRKKFNVYACKYKYILMLTA